MKRVKHYKPNVVYGLLIEGKNYYIGCHCVSGTYLTEYRIVESSYNYLSRALHRKEISRKEYFDACKLLFIEEYDTKDEALDREVELIAEYKDKYGDYCCNDSLGNKYSTKGLHYSRSEEYLQKLRELVWFTNGCINIRARECPAGFWRGQYRHK